MGRFEYLTLLGLCVLLTLPLEVVLGVRVYRQAKRLALALACTGAVFVTWDLVGAGLGHWDYNPRRTTGAGLLGLPLEEYLFFVVIPLCAILAYEAVRATLPDVSRWLRARLGRARSPR
jgi:lycopene cyclase domain-containing protein